MQLRFYYIFYILLWVCIVFLVKCMHVAQWRVSNVIAPP